MRGCAMPWRHCASARPTWGLARCRCADCHCHRQVVASAFIQVLFYVTVPSVLQGQHISKVLLSSHPPAAALSCMEFHLLRQHT